MSAGEKRRSPRLPVNLPASYRSASLALSLRVANLSADGLSVVCEQVDPLGTRADIGVELHGEGTELVWLSGTVIWQSSNPDNPGMGLRLLELTPEARTALDDYLDRHRFDPSPRADQGR